MRLDFCSIFELAIWTIWNAIEQLIPIEAITHWNDFDFFSLLTLIDSKNRYIPIALICLELFSHIKPENFILYKKCSIVFWRVVMLLFLCSGYLNVCRFPLKWTLYLIFFFIFTQWINNFRNKLILCFGFVVNNTCVKWNFMSLESVE